MGGATTGRVFGVLALFAAGSTLAACSSGSYGFDGNTNRVSTLGNLISFNSLSPPPSTSVADLEEKPTCPGIEVQDGTASNRVYGPGAETNGNVKYQFSMGDVVRECSRAGQELVLKVGVEGRALLGPVGAAGAFTAPVRIAVRNERTGKPVVSKLLQIPVTIAAGDNGAPFSLVSDPIAVPFLSSHADDDYTILVGFDAKGDGHIDAKPRRKARARG